MAQLIDVPGMGTVEFPDDMSDEEIVAAIQSNMSDPTKTANPPKTANRELYQDEKGNYVNPFAMSKEWMEPGALDKNITGIGRGFVDLGEGFKQLALLAGELGGWIEPGSYDSYTKEVDQERAAYANSLYGRSEVANQGRMGANMVPWMFAPAGRAISLFGRAAQAALTGAGMGFTQYVPEGASRLFNTFEGAKWGGGIPAALGTGAKFINAALDYAPAFRKALPGIKQNNLLTPEQKSAVKYAEKHGGEIFAPDVTNNYLIKGASYGLEQMPAIPGFSMMPPRLRQMESTQRIAKNVQRDLFNQMKNTPYEGLDEVQAIAKSQGKRAKGAQQILQDVKNAGNDWHRIQQTSGNIKLFINKVKLDKYYDEVSKLADQYGSVDTRPIHGFVNKAIANEEKSLLKNEGLLSTLNKVKQGLFEKSPATKASSILDDTGDPFVAAQPNAMIPKQFTYSQLRDFRSDLSKEIDTYFKGNNAAIGEKGVGVLIRMKDVLDNTLDQFAQSKNPQLTALWNRADKFSKTHVAPAHDRLLAASLKNSRPDEIYNQWIKYGDRKERALQYYRALDEKGRAAVRYGMVRNSYQKALNRDGHLSSGTLAAEMNKIKSARGVFFRGQDKEEINGFINFMNHAKCGFNAATKPRTGERLIPIVAAVGGGYGFMTNIIPGGAIGAGVAALPIMRQLFTTKAGRSFLTAAAKLKAGSPAMDRLVNQMVKVFERSTTHSRISEVNQ
jgi:hypothetical protein